VRRFTLIVLMSLLALQSIWSAAAHACQHECSAAVAPFGHHDHAHDDAADSGHGEGEPTDAAAGNAGTDGSKTHSHGSTAVVADLIPMVDMLEPGYLPCPYEHSFADHVPDRLLRPPLSRPV
jgi:hypothetical protein